jgi:hypothetical protein
MMTDIDYQAFAPLHLLLEQVDQIIKQTGNGSRYTVEMRLRGLVAGAGRTSPIVHLTGNRHHDRVVGSRYPDVRQSFLWGSKAQQQLAGVFDDLLPPPPPHKPNPVTVSYSDPSQGDRQRLANYREAMKQYNEPPPPFCPTLLVHRAEAIAVIEAALGYPLEQAQALAVSDGAGVVVGFTKGDAPLASQKTRQSNQRLFHDGAVKWLEDNQGAPNLQAALARFLIKASKSLKADGKIQAPISQTTAERYAKHYIGSFKPPHDGV